MRTCFESLFGTGFDWIQVEASRYWFISCHIIMVWSMACKQSIWWSWSPVIVVQTKSSRLRHDPKFNLEKQRTQGLQSMTKNPMNEDQACCQRRKETTTTSSMMSNQKEGDEFQGCTKTWVTSWIAWERGYLYVDAVKWLLSLSLRPYLVVTSQFLSWRWMPDCIDDPNLHANLHPVKDIKVKQLPKQDRLQNIRHQRLVSAEREK